jgi:endo-1,4-beta-xylanase
MKIRSFIVCVTIGIFASTWISCKKSDNMTPVPPVPPPATQDTTALKNAATFPVGVGINYTLMTGNSNYASLVKNQFSTVTFEYQMKHGAIVQDDGSFNFTNTDQLVSLVNGDGLSVYGHTLAWYQNNNANYLRSLLTTGVPGPTLIQNGSFESSTGNSFTNWFTQATGGGVASFAADSVDHEDGKTSLEVAVTTPAANVYQIQVVNDAWTATVGKQYQISFFAKSIGGGSFRAVSQGVTYYEQQIVNPGDAWTQYNFLITPTETAPQVKFQFGTAGTYFIDNVIVSDPLQSTPPTAAQLQTRVDTALKTWITAMVTHYKGKVAAWDAVNEAINDGGTGTLRNNPTPGTTTGDIFYWAEYLGRAYVAKAFQYAHAADPAALLFINDYNLESDGAKLDSLLALVAQLQAQGVPISGIGTQMHININTSQGSIDQAFVKLAATGLKIRVSELDIRIDPGNSSGFMATSNLYQQQATLYHNVVASFIHNIPPAQRYGMTVWDVTDNDSWIVTSQHDVDFPTLFDGSYNKKPAFYSYLQGLEGK